MVGNKSDLFLEQEVDDEEAVALAEEINAKFTLVSAKENYQVILHLFQSIGEEFFENKEKFLKFKLNKYVDY